MTESNNSLPVPHMAECQCGTCNVAGDQPPGGGQTVANEADEAVINATASGVVIPLVTQVKSKHDIQPVGLVHLSRVNSVPFCKSEKGVGTNIEGIVNCPDCLKMMRYMKALASKTESVMDAFYRIRKKVLEYSKSFHRVNKEKRDDWPTVQMVARSISLPMFVVANMCDKDMMRLSYHDEPKGCPQPSMSSLFVEILEFPS